MDISKIITDIESATNEISQTLTKIKSSEKRFEDLGKASENINNGFLNIMNSLEQQKNEWPKTQKSLTENQLQTIDNKFISLTHIYDNAAQKLSETLAFFQTFAKAANELLLANQKLASQITAIDFPKRFEENAKIWQTNISAQNQEIQKLKTVIAEGLSAQSKQINDLKVADLLKDMTSQLEKMTLTVSGLKEKTQECQLKIQETQTNLARLEAAQKEPLEKIQNQIVATNTEIQSQAQRQNVLIYALLALGLVLLVVLIFKS